MVGSLQRTAGWSLGSVHPMCEHKEVIVLPLSPDALIVTFPAPGAIHLQRSALLNSLQERGHSQPPAKDQARGDG